jgi:hypothetical protein
MNFSEAILDQAARLGVTVALAPDGYLEISPRSKVSRDFLAAVRAHKDELRECLELRADLHLAKQIIQGEWDGCNHVQAKAIAFKLCGNSHVLCCHAVKILRHHRRE